jgi:uncharacterized glyoxalase superfamily protein PhnB
LLFSDPIRLMPLERNDVFMDELSINLKSITPILRIFDTGKAKEFYLDFLDFNLDWEHRFADDMPLYIQVSKDGCIIHLSEHHGDCCPGAALRIEVDLIEALHSRLLAKHYKHAKPGIETTPWNSREVQVTDPFGNRIIFFQDLETQTQILSTTAV